MKVILKRVAISISKGVSAQPGIEVPAVERDGFFFAIAQDAKGNLVEIRLAQANILQIINTETKTENNMAKTTKAATKPAKETASRNILTATPLDILNNQIQNVKTKRQFTEFADKVKAAGLNFIKRQGGTRLVFKEFAISKKRGNKPMGIFETPDGEISKAILEVLSRFIAVGK